MAQVKFSRKYTYSSEHCFEACKTGFPRVGFPIWKTREVAYLVMANREEDRKTISATALIMGYQAAEITLSLSGEGVSAEELEGWMEKLFSAIEDNLPQK